jgi:DNA-binding MarR family transcriptional regulator
MEKLGGSLIDLLGVLNSPQRDDALLREAGVELDRALFPLLVALDVRGVLVVAALADLVGRDHTTVSRQLSKLESLKLIRRREGATDRRQTAAELTASGREIARKIARARRRLLAKALAAWSEADIRALATLNRRFADALLGRTG